MSRESWSGQVFVNNHRTGQLRSAEIEVTIHDDGNVSYCIVANGCRITMQSESPDEAAFFRRIMSRFANPLYVVA